MPKTYQQFVTEGRQTIHGQVFKDNSVGPAGLARFHVHTIRMMRDGDTEEVKHRSKDYLVTRKGDEYHWALK